MKRPTSTPPGSPDLFSGSGGAGSDLFSRAPAQPTRPRDSRAGEKLRDAGMDATKAAHASWTTCALGVIASLPSGWEGIAEAWRDAVCQSCGPPRKPHAWGSLTNHAQRDKLLVNTNRTEKMHYAKSHARRSPIWRRTAKTTRLY